jgi:hypothetical protein
MRDLAARSVQYACISRSSTRGRNSLQAAPDIFSVDNGTVERPCPAAPICCIRNCLRGPSGGVNLLEFSPVKKPMKWLSGDQNGNCAPSVPRSGWATAESSARTQIKRGPPGYEATKASW